MNEININKLWSISKKHKECCLISKTIYHISLLAYLTVVDYSHKHLRLSVQNKIDVAFLYIQDLVEFLCNEEVLSQLEKDLLLKDYTQKSEEIKTILGCFVLLSRSCWKSGKKDQKCDLL